MVVKPWFLVAPLWSSWSESRSRRRGDPGGRFHSQLRGDRHGRRVAPSPVQDLHQLGLGL